MGGEVGGEEKSRRGKEKSARVKERMAGKRSLSTFMHDSETPGSPKEVEILPVKPENDTRALAWL